MLGLLIYLLLSNAAAEVRPVTHAIRMESNVAVPLRDGAKLHADEYRPAVEGRSVPV